MQAVLVTGGLGFVGSHLVDALLMQGKQVTIVDNLSSNVMPPSHYPHVIQGAIEECYTQLLDQPFHEIYHLASVVGPAGVLNYAGDMARSIVMSAEAVTQLALRHKSKLMLTSTSEVYGRSGALREQDGCRVSADYSVRLEYAVAKLTTEVAALNKAKVTDLHVNVVRPFNIAGPRQLPDGGFALPRFVTAALEERPLTIFGDGQQVRAFTDVRDIVSALMAVQQCPQKGLILNLGNPANEVRILELARMVKRLSHSAAPIQHVDPKELYGPLFEEGIERVPVIDEALKALEWRPRYAIEQTILDTIEYYRPRVAAPSFVELAP